LQPHRHHDKVKSGEPQVNGKLESHDSVARDLDVFPKSTIVRAEKVSATYRLTGARRTENAKSRRAGGLLHGKPGGDILIGPPPPAAQIAPRRRGRAPAPTGRALPREALQ
jgi:hypothetical protein